MPRHSRALAVCCLILVGAAGCGSSPSAIHKSLSKQAYVTRADAICGAMDARLVALGVPRRAEDFPPFARKAAPIVESSLRRLRDLKAPDEVAADVAGFENALSAAADRLREAGAAAQSGDAASAQRLGNDARQQLHAATQAAHRVGYRVCGRFPGL